MKSTAYLWNEIYLQHETGPFHPEKPKRLSAINRVVKKADWYNDLLMVKPVLPELEHIESIHSKEYISRVKKTVEKGKKYLDSPDTAICEKSYEVALYAVGGALGVCDMVMKGEAKNGFCAVRPPGHHAEYDYAAGFCLFNNIAIAARYIQREYGVKKIAIVDWDVHHGNGTQHSFESDNSILFISLHQYPHYPGTGSKDETGKGKGEGFTLNIPMHAGSDDVDYMNAFKRLIIPALNKFEPEVILISAGFDGHFSDPLSSIDLSTDAYYEFTKLIMDTACKHSQERIIAFLEGGYNLTALADSVEKVIGALSGY